MQRGDLAFRIDMRMQYRDIAVSDDPFWIFFKDAPIDPIDYPAQPISSTSAKNGLDGRIIQCLLQIGKPFLIGSRKISRRRSAKCRTGSYPESPFLQGRDTDPGP